MNKRMQIWILSVSAAFLLVGCSSEQEQSELIRPVMIKEISLYTGGVVLTFSGFSKAEKQIDASFRVEGKIEKLPIKVGDKLNKGALIGQLDQGDFILKLKEAEAALEEANAEARNASASYRRFKALYENDAVSRNELDSSRAAHEAAKANVDKEKSNVDLASKQLKYTRLYTDRDNCYVSTKNVEVAENVIVGQKIASLSCGNLQKIEIAIPETSIYGFNEEQEVSVIYSAYPNEVYQGTVWEVGVSSEGGTTYPVTVLLNEPHKNLRPGMAVKVYIPVKEDKEDLVLTVPAVAVGEDDQGKFVYLFEDDGGEQGIARKRVIKIGELYPNGFEVIEGLKEGDKVITAGIRYLNDGRKVKLTEQGVIKRLNGESN